MNLEVIKFKYRISISASPKDADISIVSIDELGNPGELNQLVMKQYGYDNNLLPKREELASMKCALLKTGRKKPIIFVVTVEENTKTKATLNRYLEKALFRYKDQLNNKTVWIPLMGTGTGGLDMEESYNLTVKAINNFVNESAVNVSFILSFPNSDKGYDLIEKININKLNVDRVRIENFLHEHKYKFYMVVSDWKVSKDMNDFYKLNIWKDDSLLKKSKEVLDDINVNDVLVVKSNFKNEVLEGLMQIQAVGLVTSLSDDRINITIDWKIKDLKLDAFDWSYSINTVKRIVDKDLLKLISYIGIQLFEKYFGSSKAVKENVYRTAAIANDSEKGIDYLSIDKDVRAFAQVIAANSFEPPLAIAILGKWGSGKSFFMRSLKEQIQLFSENLQAPFCKGVVQIHFNAWSYMDSNLWASLVSRIFEGLQLYIKNESISSEHLKNIKKILSKELNVTRSNIDSLEEKKKVIQNQIKILKGKSVEIKNANQHRINKLRNRTSWKVLKNVDQNFKASDKIKRALESNDSFKESRDFLKKVIPERYWNNPEAAYEEAKSKYTLIKLFFHKKNFFYNLLILGAVFFVIIVLPLLIDLSKVFVTNVDLTIPKTVLCIIASAGLIGKKIESAYREMQPVVSSLWKIKEDYQEARKKAMDDFEQKEKALRLEIDNGEKELLMYLEQIQKEKASLLEIDHKIHNALSSETLYAFIDDRSKSEDYKKYLGIISTIRKDFEILNELFIGHKREIVKDADVKAFRQYFERPIERIVLYIDDLDRCPEENVVEVLEAVNLLMAYPLFVVIVGVDPRWVKNALIQKHSLQFTGRIAENSSAIAGVELIEPSNYLEKIFQIAFHLKDASQESVQEMIRQVAGYRPVQENIKPITAANTNTENNEPEIVIDVNSINSSQSIQNKNEEVPGKEVLVQNKELTNTDVATDDEEKPILEYIELTQREIDALSEMGEVIGSNPRLIKRFVNIFKVVKAHEDYNLNDTDSQEDLLVVIFLLAISTGKYRCLFSAFDTYINDEMHANRTLQSYLTSTDTLVKYWTERNDLNKTLSGKPTYSILQKSTVDVFRLHNKFIKRFTFKSE